MQPLLCASSFGHKAEFYFLEFIYVWVICFHIRYNWIFSNYLISKTNIFCVLLGTAGRYRPSRDTGTKRTLWTDGKRKTTGRAESSHICSEISALHLMLHHIVWLAFILQGVEGVLGPTGIIGPSGHPVCICYSVSCAELHVSPVCFLAMMEWFPVFFLSIREPRVTEEVKGRWCVVLFDKSFFCLLYA